MRRFRSAALLGMLVAFAAACEDLPREVTAPDPLFNFSATASPLECPTAETLSATGTLDVLGGTVEVGGHNITLPAAAVLLPTEITLTASASNYMEIDITANGLDSFQFEQPVTVTISYERCARSNIEKGPLSAWYWDPALRTLLEDMDADDDKLERNVTFSTSHLSGYVVAN